MNGTAPDYFLHSAATGGTLSSVGRYAKKYSLPTEIVLADTQYSLYYDYVTTGRFDGRRVTANAQLARKELTRLQEKWVPPGVAGTGFGPLWGLPVRGATSSLVSAVVDRVLKVPDLASVAAMQLLSERYGISGGPSTGLNFIGALEVGARVGRAGRQVTVATLICDSGRNYAPTYYNRTWLGEHFQPHGGLAALDCWRRVIADWLIGAGEDDGGDGLLGRGSDRCGTARSI